MKNNHLPAILRSFVLPVISLFYASCAGKDLPSHTIDDVVLSVNNKYAAIGEVISFEARKSPSGASAVWNWGDGSQNGEGIRTTHTFERDGLYTITLTVSAGGVDRELTARVKVEGAGLTRVFADFDYSKVWIMAHRGSTDNSTVPENSIAAVERCIASGAVDVIEIDPRVTKDGRIVIMHDETIDRTTNGTGRVADLTYGQIQQYFLKMPNGTVTTQKVPTLEEMLLAGRGKVYFDLDSKTDQTKMYAVVNDCGMRDRVLFYTGTNTELGKQFLSIYDGNHVYPYYNGKNAVAYLDLYSRRFMVQMDYGIAVDNSLAAQASGMGFLVSVNHLSGFDSSMVSGNYTTIDNMLATGSVDMIQTDYAIKLHNYLVTKGKR
jgi:glycerophosphoryl diester phosphodiesterase